MAPCLEGNGQRVKFDGNLSIDDFKSGEILFVPTPLLYMLAPIIDARHGKHFKLTLKSDKKGTVSINDKSKSEFTIEVSDIQSRLHNLALIRTAFRRLESTDY